MDYNNYDIRSLSFKNKNLTGVSFYRSNAGLHPLFAGLLVCLSLLCSTLAAAIFQLGIASVISDFNSGLINNVTILLLLSIFFIATIFKGIVISTLSSISIAVISIMLSIITAVAKYGYVKSNTVHADLLAGSIEGIITIIVVSFGIIVISIAGTLAVSVTKEWAIVGIVIFAMAGAGVSASIHTSTSEAVLASVISMIAIFISAYIAVKALAGDKVWKFISQFSIALATIKGTSFRYANLTEVDFTQANLRNTDFRDADITRAYWKDAKSLALSRLGNTYLSNPKIQRLVVTLNGKKQNFDGLNMEGVNLKTAKLQNASFVGTNLNYTNLENVNLSGANLKQAQLDGADLTDAILTDAIIEDWGVTSDTKLDKVKCEYVYLRKGKKERRPSSGNFAPGEFAKLFQKSLETVDLIFRNGIDWDAFAYSFKKVEVENQGAQLDVQSIEKKGDGVLLVRVAVAPDADKAKIHNQFMQGYEFAAKALEAQYQGRLEDKEKIINQLFSTINQQNKLLAQTGDKVSIYYQPNSQFAGGIVDANTVEAQQIGGNIQNNDTEDFPS